jgi:hypothetical protein
MRARQRAYYKSMGEFKAAETALASLVIPPAPPAEPRAPQTADSGRPKLKLKPMFRGRNEKNETRLRIARAIARGRTIGEMSDEDAVARALVQLAQLDGKELEPHIAVSKAFDKLWPAPPPSGRRK